MNINGKKQLHSQYWEKTNPRPLFLLRSGGIFPINQFTVSKKLIMSKSEITPDMLNVEEFLPDYEQSYKKAQSIPDSDTFWVADPYSPIPWVEAMLGCRIYPTKSSFISEPCIDSPEQLENLRIDFEGAWAKKYFEFLTELDKLSGGRFPIGHSILRGLLDCLGAVIGQTRAIYALYDNEDSVETFLNNLTEDFITLVRLYHEHITPFHGGSICFSLWSPGKSMNYQDDLISISSPDIFKKFLKDKHDRICSEYAYSAIHLHPPAFIVLDGILEVGKLGIVQVQKDFGGPPIIELVPEFKRILSVKRLVISGDFNIEELDCVLENLPHEGLLLQIIKETAEEAAIIAEYIQQRFK